LTAKNTSAIRSANKKRPNPNVGDWDAIDRNAGLSRDDKYHQRSETAAQAIDFEASKTLARAREAVELAVAKNDSHDGVGKLKAMKETERGLAKGDG
jgi:hypothetical protein